MKTSSFATVTKAVRVMYHPAGPNRRRDYSLSFFPQLYLEFYFHLYNRIETLPCVPGASLYSNLTHRALLLATMSAKLLESTAQTMFSSFFFRIFILIEPSRFATYSSLLSQRDEKVAATQTLVVSPLRHTLSRNRIRTTMSG